MVSWIRWFGDTPILGWETSICLCIYIYTYTHIICACKQTTNHVCSECVWPWWIWCAFFETNSFRGEHEIHKGVIMRIFRRSVSYRNLADIFFHHTKCAKCGFDAMGWKKNTMLVCFCAENVLPVGKIPSQNAFESVHSSLQSKNVSPPMKSQWESADGKLSSVILFLGEHTTQLRPFYSVNLDTYDFRWILGYSTDHTIHCGSGHSMLWFETATYIECHALLQGYHRYHPISGRPSAQCAQCIRPAPTNQGNTTKKCGWKSGCFRDPGRFMVTGSFLSHPSPPRFKKWDPLHDPKYTMLLWLLGAAYNGVMGLIDDVLFITMV